MPRKSWAVNELSLAAKDTSSVEELSEKLGVSIKAVYSRAFIEGFSLKDHYHPPKSREHKKRIHREWYVKNREKQDARTKLWRKNERERLITAFGGACVSCGMSDPICLDFDHINNDGYKDEKKNIIFHVKRTPERFQLLCKNCNWKKEYYRRKNAIQN